MPGWAENKDKAAKATVEPKGGDSRLRDSIDRAIALTAAEREDLATRQAALRTDPVASGSGGIILGLVATALSIGLTIYLLKKTKDTLPPPQMGRP